MSNWYEDAQWRLEKKQQQEEQQRLQALQQQEQLYNKLLGIVYDAGALEKLTYIGKTFWGCGQIHPYRRKVEPIEWISNTWTNEKSIIHGYSEAGLQLHFEIEVLKFVVHGGMGSGRLEGGGDPGWGQSTFTPESKELERSTKSIVLEISAVQSEPNGSIQFKFAGKELSTPLSNFAALIQELDEAIYLYCQTVRSPLEEKEAQDRINKSEEEKYRKYKPWVTLNRRKWYDWFS